MGRYYEIDGVKYPSVTTILKVIDAPGLDIWRAKLGLEEANKIMVETGKFGTEVHAGLEVRLRGQKYRVPVEFKEQEKNILSCVDLALAWLDNKGLSLLKAEHQVHSTAYGFAGTLDLIAKGEKEVAIIDFKTSTAIYNTHELQVAAYRQACLEVTEEYIPNKCYVVALGKGTFKEPKVKEVDFIKMFDLFKHAIALYRGLIEKEEKDGKFVK